MLKAERRFRFVRKRAPIFKRRLKKNRSADDVRIHKFAGTVNRTIDMTFGREMKNRIGLKRLKRDVHKRHIADVSLEKTEPPVGTFERFGV